MAKEETLSLIDIFIFDEILIKIFSYLTICDLIMLERVSKKWRQLSLKSWISRKDIILTKHVGSNFPLKCIKEILRRGGKYINTLDMTGVLTLMHVPEKSIISAINNYCHYLQHLKIYISREDGENLLLINSGIVGNLKTLHISFVFSGKSDTVENNVSALVKKAVNVEDFYLSTEENIKGTFLLHLSDKCKTLTLRRCYEIDNTVLMKVLNRFPKLVNLNIYNAPITPTTISKISSRLTSLYVGKSATFFSGKKYKEISLQNLRVLDIKQNTKIDNEMLSVLVEMCPLLEELNLEYLENVTDKGFRSVGKLHNLKILNLNYDRIGKEVFAHLGQSLSNLENVSCQYCEYLNSAALLSMIESCPKLNFFDIGHFKLTDKFFRAALKLVDERPMNMPLTIQYEGLTEVVHEFKSLKKRNDRSLKYNYCRVMEMDRTFDDNWCFPVKKIFFVSSSTLSKKV